ncbi:MAG TPA: DUF1501 domain-containing protein [Thermomicrobiaceae bacterium]|nr:DUF1501 domain-containing protein [Thermomicrobiaceae bacterium]
MLDRRTFVRGSLVAVAGGIAMPNIFTRALHVAAADNVTDAGTRTLIVIQLAGGNDGLNTVVPYQDGVYLQARPTIGVKPDAALPLDDRLALHPNLKELKGIWDQGHLAIVESVGYDHPSLSHFQSMDIWQTADPTQGRRDGWLSKLVEGMVDSQGHPLGALALGADLPPALCCPPTPPPVVDRADRYRLLPDARHPQLTNSRDEALRRLYASYQAPAPYAALLEATSESAATSSTFLQQVATSYTPAATYPESTLANGLKLFAALINGGHGLRIGYVLLGGFDTHADQLQHQPQLFATLSSALGAFYADLAAKGKEGDVMVVTWSEFGRRVAENTSGGTDHGTAAPLFVLGGAVKGGLYGQPPDLQHLDDGNLRFAVDFRSVYASVLEQWLQADASAVLGQKFDQIPLLG